MSSSMNKSSDQEKGNCRKRAPNFTIREKTLLLKIISNYKKIIENKQTNATTWRDKDVAWEKITNSFNSENEETYRTKENLKKYYENIKKTVRKEVAEERKEIYKTGGGMYMPKSDPVKDLTLSLINKKTVFRLTNEFDDDQEYPREYQYQGKDVCVVEEVGQVEDEPMMNQSLIEHNYNIEEATTIDAATVKNLENRTNANDLLTSPVLNKEVTSKEQNQPTEEFPAYVSQPKTPSVHHTQEFSGHVSQPKTPSLQHSWTKRRRPTHELNLSSKVQQQHIDTAIAKQKCYEAELVNIEARRQQDKVLFDLQKEKTLLEIETKKVELNRLLNKI